MRTPITTRRLVWVIIAAVGVGYLATLRDGHDWGDDFSLYIHQAKLLVEGRLHEGIGYRYNPDHPIGPATAPPVFPLLLAPVYGVFGLNLMAMKVVVVLSFLAALLTIWWCLSRTALLTEPEAAAVIAVIGFNPLFWGFRNQILSDFPFLCVLYAALGLTARAQITTPSRPAAAWLLGGALYLAYATRSIGLVLPIAMVVTELGRRRRLTRATLISLAVCAGLVAAQTLWVHSERGHLVQFGQPLPAALSHASYYSKELRDLWKNGYAGFFMRLLFLTVNGLALFGYWKRLRRVGVTAFELFPVLYIGVILSWPHYQGIRFLFPVIPLYIGYALIGLRELPVCRTPRIRQWAFAGLLCAIGATYGLRYTTLDYGPIPEGIAQPETRELFDYITRDTPPDAVWVFAKPRALALFTGRTATIYSLRDDDALLQHLRQTGVSYAITSPIFYTDHAVFQPCIDRHPELFEPVFHNRTFRVYRVHHPMPPADPQSTSSSVIR